MEKKLKTELTKEKIFFAALEEFGENGYDNATVNNICKKHSISKGLIYHNFQSKENLYTCCVKYAVDEFIKYMSNFDIGSNLKKYMQHRCDFFMSNSHLGRIIFDAVISDSPTNTEKIKEIRKSFDDFNLKLFKSAIKKNKLRKSVTEDDAVEYYTLLQNALNGYMSYNKSGDLTNHEKKLEKILDYMFYGIAEKETKTE